eukprot:CAMPEP_0178581596 /NCGR_PEP_ID=MMETSP0697-20121206/23269_1 /TAXON_ID=265572 /ORGANISM="Extubocellulus spinifer, Strain CCMP396" /LENGTH=43 /DNA_ID= /DNA_START= /DNA_END= /DNA_ORIENTATION=
MADADNKGLAAGSGALILGRSFLHEHCTLCATCYVRVVIGVYH